jgi:hypothetical protein
MSRPTLAAMEWTPPGKPAHLMMDPLLQWQCHT